MPKFGALIKSLERKKRELPAGMIPPLRREPEQRFVPKHLLSDYIDDIRRNRASLDKPIILRSEDKIIYTFLPKGNAEGCQRRQIHIDYHRPIWTNFAKKLSTQSPFNLWQQEQYIYNMECSLAMREALQNLDLIIPRPRKKGHKEIDTTPYPEDFRATIFDVASPTFRERIAKRALSEAIQNWLV